MALPLISILTPFKNTSAYLDDCLLSIINQSYKNWELVIVDDHSTDSSYDIVKQWAEEDARIKLFRNTGSGIIEALRHAFHESQGTLITRMDSDDIMYSNKLEHMAGQLLDSGFGHVALGQVQYFGDDGISEGYSKYEHWLNKLTERGSNYTEIYKECVIPSPCWMVYREDLERCGAFFPDR
ncbi:MAG: glycosyltransferase, partial [Bacteroidia bacterium]|nr:glycosyltransferase [Bacteroidia bacterium]